ncbi:MAG: hypothetical protein AB7O24_16425 [Kofleriaceae bacterium]
MRSSSIGCVLAVSGAVLGGCVETDDWSDTEDDAEQLAENLGEIEQSITAAQFVPSGSNLNFIGIYRMKIRDTGNCMNQSGLFLPCKTNDADLSDQFAIYQGADANYHLCVPSPPRRVSREYCTEWDYDEGVGGNVWPYCVESAIGEVYESTCMAPATTSSSVVGAVRTELSVKDQGMTAFVRANAEVIAMATSTPNEFVLKSRVRNSAGTEKRIYFRDVNTNAIGLSKSSNSDNAKLNRHFVPLRVSSYDGPQKKIVGK